MGSPSSSEYTLLGRQSSDSHEKEFFMPSPPKANRLLSWPTFGALAGLLTISLCINLALLITQFKASTVVYREPPSPFVGLTREVPSQYSNTSIYYTGNTTLDEPAWQDLFDENRHSLVAITDDEARAHDLLLAQRWPWDSQKGIYAINGFHLVHCVVTLREALHAARAHRTTPTHLVPEHIDHCLDFLRDDAMCNADDRLLYTGRVHAQTDARFPFPGIGQPRSCRRWDWLKDWSKAHSACYQMEKVINFSLPTTERYKHCPDGRVLWE